MATVLNHLRNLFRMPLLHFTASKRVPTLAVAIFTCFIASFTIPLFSVVLSQIFTEFTLRGADEITGPDLLQNDSNGCVQLLALGALAWFFNAIYYVLFVVLLKKDQRFLEEQEEGARTFLGCLQVHIQELQTATSQSLPLVLQYLFRILVSLSLAFYTSWNLSLAILTGIPVVALIVPYLSPKINGSIEVQQCLNAQDVEQEKFSRRMDKAASHYVRQALFNHLQISAMRFMMFAMIVQGFWYGSHLVTSGKLN
ncbi:ABC transporter type 1, transmembrane domain-containing protein [Aspergillus undulatus]|uniref:ABC transporter type 1, transmembrane domain-containing protein n=1 Tax=Aspergillus undulatus TaxID=1810928 RepID=UPI003CCD401C